MGFDSIDVSMKEEAYGRIHNSQVIVQVLSRQLVVQGLLAVMFLHQLANHFSGGFLVLGGVLKGLNRDGKRQLGGQQEGAQAGLPRSEEHTSELQSRGPIV